MVISLTPSRHILLFVESTCFPVGLLCCLGGWGGASGWASATSRVPLLCSRVPQSSAFPPHRTGLQTREFCLAAPFPSLGTQSAARGNLKLKGWRDGRGLKEGRKPQMQMCTRFPHWLIYLLVWRTPFQCSPVAGVWPTVCLINLAASFLEQVALFISLSWV